MTRAIADTARTIRVPVHMVETINRLSRAERHLVQMLGRDPAEAEIARELGVTAARLAEIRTTALQALSLHAPVGEEPGLELGSRVEDPTVVDPLRSAEDHQRRAHLARELRILSPHARKILGAAVRAGR